MRIEYLLCDICGKKIDFEKSDRVQARFEMMSIRMTFGNKLAKIQSTSPFSTEKVGELPNSEIVEKTGIDFCEECAKKIETLCRTLKEENTKK